MTALNIQTLLVVEDNIGDARLLREMLNEPVLNAIALEHVQTMREAETYLAQHTVDIVLLDLGLPDAQGLEALRRTHVAAPRTPSVVLTGIDDEELARSALQQGAQDYLIKGQIETRGLMRALRYAIERKAMEETARQLSLQIAHSAQHDSLTGLPNRVLLQDRLAQAIAIAGRNQKKAAVLFLDLDGFKHINDSLGHSVGDKLLQSVARRLGSCVREGDTVSRQGGDEFVVLLSELERAEAAAVVADRILKAVKRPHPIEGEVIHVGTSIGLSVFPNDGATPEVLIKHADTAMYQAKERSRGSYRFFTPAMNERAVERRAIEEGLRAALERQEMHLHFQPKIDLKTGGISGTEALLRWAHPLRGEIPPSIFIPIAEECGLIRSIGDWVLMEACWQSTAWRRAGLNVGTMAVNVSAVQFADDKFLNRLMAILEETGIEPGKLELELTESVLMKRAQSTAGKLQAIRERGVHIAIDDFGTGYSSLSYLQNFPVDILKIDRSFIQEIGSGDQSALVGAVIEMGRALRLSVVAEGIETRRQLDVLDRLNCDQGQGYYFSRPVPAPDLAAMVHSGRDFRSLPLAA